MKLIMILKQTLTSKFQGTHWALYAPINCVSKINGHLLKGTCDEKSVISQIIREFKDETIPCPGPQKK